MDKREKLCTAIALLVSQLKNHLKKPDFSVLQNERLGVHCFISQ